MQARPTREHGLDALRVFAFAVLILYHAGMGYVSWPWHVKNPETSTALEHVMVFSSRWRLPLLFFISGAGVAFALGRRSYGAFARERLVRLLIPLVVGMLVIVPPQIYVERLAQGVDYESYWAFHRTVFELVPYPEGGALSWHHLWFVAYILVYALASIPLFALLRGDRGRAALAGLATGFERWGVALYLVPLPVAISNLLLVPHWPTTHDLISDWATLTASWLTFLWGFVFASERRLLDVVTRRRIELAVVALVLTIAFYVARETTPSFSIRTLLSTYTGFAWLLALVGWSRTLVRDGTPALRYATEAVYPFYIVHQTITVALVYALAPVELGVWPKLALAALGTFLGSWAVFELVRRVRPLRPLFGLKYRG